MDIDISDTQNDVKIDKRYIKRLVKDILLSEGEEGPVEVSIAFVENETICRLNSKYRGVETATDVLAFSMEEKGLLGDVVICPEVAMSNAAGMGHPVDEEISLLVIHGMLHLLGYDHTDQTGKDAMWARQKELLKKAQDKRTGIR